MSGFTLESLRFKDWSFEKFVGSKWQALETFKPVRKIEDADRVPDVFQGDTKACVPCAVSWIAMFCYPGLIIDWRKLAERCGTDEKGTKPSVVLKRAKDDGIIPNFLILKDRSAKNLYRALHLSPLVIGVTGLPMVPEPHFMVLWDVTEDGKNWRCFTWDKEDRQGYLELSLDFPIAYAASFVEGKGYVPDKHSIIDVITDKLRLFFDH